MDKLFKNGQFEKRLNWFCCDFQSLMMPPKSRNDRPVLSFDPALDQNEAESQRYLPHEAVSLPEKEAGACRERNGIR